MPVLPCCVGCQGPMAGPCGPGARRLPSGMGPNCPHASGWTCNSPCGDVGVIHGARGGVAGSYYSCGNGCIGGCTSGLCGSCCGPACG